MADENEHALIIEIPRSSLPETDRLVAEVVGLEGELAAALSGLGSVDGHDFGLLLGADVAGELLGASIYLYGASASAMLEAIEPVLASNPISSDSTVRLREGKPGTEERRVKIEGQKPASRQ